VALKEYKVVDDEENLATTERSEGTEFFDRVEKNVLRQMACVHNNVLRIFGACRQDTSLMLVMPLISAGSLQAILRQDARESPGRTEIREMFTGGDDRKRSLALADVFAGISAALAYLHGFQRPVAHLDVKPANVLVTLLSGGMLQPKLCDFDAARVAAKDGGSMSGTRNSGAATASSCPVAEGTFKYMPPERLRNKEGSESPAADMYAFAMVMLFCITGSGLSLPRHRKHGPTWIGELDTEWVVRIVEGERPALPPGTRDMNTYEDDIQACWDADAASRPTSSHLAAEHLKRLKLLRGISTPGCRSTEDKLSFLML